jgi:hypothetical protein
MRWLAYIILVVSLLVSACGSLPGNPSDQIAVIDWQKASSVHPRYEALQKAKADFEAAVKFRNEQAEQGKRQIVLLNKLVEIKQSGKQSFLAADYATRLAEREAQERAKLASEANATSQAADEIVAPEQAKVLEEYQLPILNLRLKLENVKLTPEERTALEQELAANLNKQYSELEIIEKKRQAIIREKLADQKDVSIENMRAYAAELKTAMSGEHLAMARNDEEKLGQGPKELAKLMESLDKQVEIKQKNYEHLRKEIDADVQSALLKVLNGRKDILVVKKPLVNLTAVDLTEKVCTELKKIKK